MAFYSRKKAAPNSRITPLSVFQIQIVRRQIIQLQEVLLPSCPNSDAIFTTIFLYQLEFVASNTQILHFSYFFTALNCLLFSLLALAWYIKGSDSKRTLLPMSQ